MSCRISVVVWPERDGPWLADLVSSLDEQSLAYNEFEVIFARTGDEALSRRVKVLAERRPYVQVSAHSTAADLLSDASGTWVVQLGHAETNPRFFAEGLERIVDFGDAAGCDVVVARLGMAQSALNAALLTDRVFDGAALDESLGRACLIAQRRETAILDVDALSSARSVGVLGTYPTLRSKAAAPDRGRPLQPTESAAHWQDGRLVVNIIGSATGVAAESPVVFALHHKASGLEFWLSAASAQINGDSVTASVAIDVRTAAVGGPLAAGVWELRVGLADPTGGWTALEPVLTRSYPAGIVDGIFVVPRSNAKILSLDVGARRSSIVGRVAPDATAVTESHRGTLLTMQLGAVVHGQATVPGALYLDGFELPARLVCADGRARVECWVSGLAGTAQVSTQFGGGSLTPTGLSMVTSGTGQMSVIATLVKADPPPTAPATVERQPSGVVRARRAVPSWMEPAVKSIARIPLARKAYRALSVKSPGRN